MSKGTRIVLGVLAGVLALIIIVVGGGISIYNGIVTAEATVEEKGSDVRVYLQRRSDLIPNLVSTVRGYASHEEEIFTSVAEARSRLAGAGTMEESIAADAELTGALSRLIAIAEAYPDLKASANFIALQDELAGAENRIATARRDYNSAVQSYNVRIRRFPSSVIAGMFGFERATMFEGSEGIDIVPDVNFE